MASPTATPSPVISTPTSSQARRWADYSDDEGDERSPRSYCERSNVSLIEAGAAVAAQVPRAEDNFTMHRSWPADFLLVCSSRRVRDDVVAAGVVDGRGFSLRFSPWNRQLQAVRCPLRFRAHLELTGIPAHAWNRSTVVALLGSAAWVERLGASTANREDLGRFQVVAWLDNINQLPREKALLIEEPDDRMEEDEGLVLPGDALVPLDKFMLRYIVKIRLVRAEDMMQEEDGPAPGGGGSDGGADGDGRRGRCGGVGHDGGRPGAGGFFRGPRDTRGGEAPRRRPAGEDWGGSRRVAINAPLDAVPWPEVEDEDHESEDVESFSDGANLERLPGQNASRHPVTATAFDQGDEAVGLSPRGMPNGMDVERSGLFFRPAGPTGVPFPQPQLQLCMHEKWALDSKRALVDQDGDVPMQQKSGDMPTSKDARSVAPAPAVDCENGLVVPVGSCLMGPAPIPRETRTEYVDRSGSFQIESVCQLASPGLISSPDDACWTVSSVQMDSPRSVLDLMDVFSVNLSSADVDFDQRIGPEAMAARATPVAVCNPVAFRGASRAAVVCLQETKMAVISDRVVRECLGPSYDKFFFLPAIGTRGGILLAWQSCMVSVTHPHYSDNAITARISTGVDHSWWFTGVYGPQNDVDKLAFLQELQDIRDLHAGPWIVAGDFNLILNPEDKNQGGLHRRMMTKFRRTLASLELKELYLNGRRFTWTNEQERPTLERLDRVFATVDWEARYPDAFLSALSSGPSDHCPLLLCLAPDLHRGRRFQFQSFWPKVEGFLEVVQEAWDSQQWEPNPFKRLDAKLRAVAKRLSCWSSKFIGNVKLQILLASELILRFDVAMESRQLSPQERGLRCLLKKKLLGLASLERTLARQRSRILWLREGDACTRFFHTHASHRRRKNFISHLLVDNVRISDHVEKAEVVDSFFENLLGVAGDRPFSLDVDFLGVQSMDLQHIDEAFSEEEVLAAIRGMPLDKCPGPDGFSARFFVSCWSIIKDDVMDAFHSLSGLDSCGFGSVNSSLITLLPKKPGAEEVRDFRPISLIHGIAKWVAKAEEQGLLTRLAATGLQHRTSIYADDVVTFLRPSVVDFQVIFGIIEDFGEASDLRTNFDKCSANLIRCSAEDRDLVERELHCPITQFPLRYLGLPLSLRKPSVAQLQTLVDRVAAKLPSWKASMLNRGGRLELVKTTLSSIPIFTMMSLDIPIETITAIEKIIRGFLWKGRKDVHGGHCLVAWDRVCMPKELGGSWHPQPAPHEHCTEGQMVVAEACGGGQAMA
uniref:Uncharacterized protein n=1 Tax=Avena sativa TaxID=4498 RepID=A0ACD5YE76_AVESA